MKDKLATSPAQLFAALILFACALAPVTAQPAATASEPTTPTLIASPTADGFVPIFNGKNLDGWDGDPKYWRAENGNLVGEITPATVIQRNTFVIWRGGTPANFELKVDYKISSHGNSGVNYRSIELTDAKWSLAGYQFDIDGQDRNRPPVRYTGQNYEERGRTFLAKRGEVARIDETSKPTIIGSVGDGEAMKSFIVNDGWNEAHLIVRGNVMIHLLNGHVMSIVVDDDAAKRKMDGLIGVQVHQGPPMKVEYRNFLLKEIK